MNIDVEKMMKRLRYKLKNQTISDQELLYFVKEGLEIAPKLQIYEEKNILRLILLQFLFSHAQLETRLIRETLLKTLTYSAWDEDKRLDFIYKNLINRQPS